MLRVGGGRRARKAEEREERKPGGSFVMSGRSNGKGKELMGMGCSLHRPLGIHIVTILSTGGPQ